MKVLIIGGLSILMILVIFGKIVDALYSISYQLEEIKSILQNYKEIIGGKDE